MDKITINYNKNKISFGIERYKIIYGFASDTKYIIKNSIIKRLKRIEDSELSKENLEYFSFKINDNEVSDRKTNLVSINDYFNFGQEEKMTSKSIYVPLLESLFDGIEYNDIVNTINVLQTDLSNYMNDTLNEITTQYKVKVKFDELNIKNIIKQLYIYTTFDEYQVNLFNFNQEEVIIYQLQLVCAIAEKRKDLQYIVLMDVERLTKNIINKIKNIKVNNILILVFPIYIDRNKKIDISNYLLVNKKVIDVSNEVEVYEKITLNLSMVSSLEETYEILNKYLNDIKNDKFNELSEII